MGIRNNYMADVRNGNLAGALLHDVFYRRGANCRCTDILYRLSLARSVIMT